jgi:hypothetical protein
MPPDLTRVQNEVETAVVPSDADLDQMSAADERVACANMIYWSVFGRAFAVTQDEVDAWGVVMQRALARF